MDKHKHQAHVSVEGERHDDVASITLSRHYRWLNQEDTRSAPQRRRPSAFLSTFTGLLTRVISKINTQTAHQVHCYHLLAYGHIEVR
ncbi:hypothetical protein GQ600_18830 [Phytophthora cactorum]|nr:hypothetical protein GQ600_18830 [Phytophthora cactorum]